MTRGQNVATRTGRGRIASILRSVAQRARYLRPAPGLAETFEQWLVAMASSLDPDTIRTYRRTYVRKHWLPFFRTMDRARDPAVLADYARLARAIVEAIVERREVAAA